MAKDSINLVLTNQMHCPKEWYPFGGSCYSLANVTSTPMEVNRTCLALHLNASLMYIRQSAELFFAAYLLIENELETLIVQFAPHLLDSKPRGETIFDLNKLFSISAKKRIPILISDKSMFV
jgi:hypothetical protein